MGIQTITGKAFEFACLNAFYEYLDARRADNVFIEENEPYRTAQEKFGMLSISEQKKYMLSAKTAVKIMVKFEPHLQYGKGKLQLSLNSDSAGQSGDVRDLLFIRSSEDWEIGISCKNNHAALKHPRITRSCNFGRDWVGHDCSDDFIEALNIILDPLDGSQKWNTISNKMDRYYVPILNCFKNEIRRLCNTYPDTSERILRYFFGSNDFYKVISLEKIEETKIMVFNLNGTMNKPAGEHKPSTKVPQLKMPTRLFNIEFLEGTKTTISLTFDGGWAVSMRLHNKDKIAKPTSLAWDVNLRGMPPELYQQQRSWYE